VSRIHCYYLGMRLVLLVLVFLPVLVGAGRRRVALHIPFITGVYFE